MFKHVLEAGKDKQIVREVDEYGVSFEGLATDMLFDVMDNGHSMLKEYPLACLAEALERSRMEIQGLRPYAEIESNVEEAM